MKKIFVLAVAVLCLTANAQTPVVNNIPEVELKGKFIDVDKYEAARSALYDAALNLCLEFKASDNGDWERISPQYRAIISAYRVPSLEVLLSAIKQVENDQSAELADKYDEVLYDYDEALYHYNQIINK